MKFVIQRVSEAKVVVDGATTGEIGKGFLVFIGVCNEDTTEIADKLVKKLLGLRIFADEEGKTNLALQDVGGFAVYAADAFRVLNGVIRAAGISSTLSGISGFCQ